VQTTPEGATPRQVPARTSAYGDLITAVLDLRPPTATATFDQALSDAVATGQLSESLARQLRSLQRETVRDVIAHASAVLPATLVRLEGSTTEVVDLPPESGAQAEAAGTMTEPVVLDRVDDPAPPPVTDTPVDLTARRLLVAGLRPIPDQPFP
jgi:hypothetical protein